MVVYTRYTESVSIIHYSRVLCNTIYSNWFSILKVRQIKPAAFMNAFLFLKQKVNSKLARDCLHLERSGRAHTHKQPK